MRPARQPCISTASNPSKLATAEFAFCAVQPACRHSVSGVECTVGKGTCVPPPPQLQLYSFCGAFLKRFIPRKLVGLHETDRSQQKAYQPRFLKTPGSEPWNVNTRTVAPESSRHSPYLCLGQVFLGRRGNGVWIPPGLGGSLLVQGSLSAVLGGIRCCRQGAALVTRFLALIGRNRGQRLTRERAGTGHC